ncbi:MAG: hypothetical protein N2505_00555 [Endomicrobia bacterium]|nr:hypothetical protein [Endomicrobiia bacterium]
MDFTHFLTNIGLDKTIIQHIKPYNIEKQLTKIKQFSKQEIQRINKILSNIENKEYIFPLFYAFICNFDIKTFADYFDNALFKNKKLNSENILNFNHEELENAMKKLVNVFNNIDSIILVIELLDENICDIDYIKHRKYQFTISEINDKTFQVIKQIKDYNIKINNAYVIKALEKQNSYFFQTELKTWSLYYAEYIERFYSLYDSLDEKICILNTSIEKVIIRDSSAYILQLIYKNFDNIKKIGWKNFISVDFTKFKKTELSFIKYITPNNFHHVINYSGNIRELFLYLIADDDNIAKQLIQYLPQLPKGSTDRDIKNLVMLYKHSKPFEFIFNKHIHYEAKHILTKLLLEGYSPDLVLHEDFLQCLNNKDIYKIKESLNKNINVLLYFGTKDKSLTHAKKVLEEGKIQIKTIEKLINNYLMIEKDLKNKKELLAYFVSAKTKERKNKLYPVISNFIKQTNQQRKSLFYLAFQKNVGFSLIETEMINLFKQFLSF